MSEDLFEVVSGAEAGTRFALTGLGAVLGRDPASDVVISDPRVSRRHARVWLEGPALMIQDLGSTGGTAVNGTFITSPTILAPGDQIRLGLTELRVVWAPPMAATVMGPIVPPPQESVPPPPAPPVHEPPVPEAVTPVAEPQPAEAPPAAPPEPEPEPVAAPTAAPPEPEPVAAAPAGHVEIQPPPLDFDHDPLAETEPATEPEPVAPAPEPAPELAPEDDAYATFQRPIVIPEPQPVAEPEAEAEDEYVDVEPPSAAPPGEPPVPEPVASQAAPADLTSVRPVITPEDLQAVRAEQALPPPTQAPSADSPPPPVMERQPAAPPPPPSAEDAERRERNVRAAKEIADAALLSQAGRMPGWLYRITSMFRR